ncbi:MAG TPA: flagellar basal body-associated FliL family protein [Bacillota bacterium]|nr:flagellar basal body-associated FliL family protein [Bacillota bacterium]
MADKKQNGQEGQPAPAAGNGNKGLIKIIAIVGVLVVLFCAGIAYGVSQLVISATSKGGAEHGSEEKGNTAALGTSFEVGTFTTNIGPDGAHIAKVKLVFALSDEKLTEEVTNKKAKIDDAVIKILRAKSFDDLRKINSTDKLKVEIKDKVNTFLASGRVDDVFITDFITQ